MVNNGPCQMKGVVYGAKVIKNTEQTTEFYTELTTRVFNPISLRAPPPAFLRLLGTVKARILNFFLEPC